jgi:hypothetical protein
VKLLRQFIRRGRRCHCVGFLSGCWFPGAGFEFSEQAMEFGVAVEGEVGEGGPGF